MTIGIVIMSFNPTEASAVANVYSACSDRHDPIENIGQKRVGCACAPVKRLPFKFAEQTHPAYRPRRGPCAVSVGFQPVVGCRFDLSLMKAFSDVGLSGFYLVAQDFRAAFGGCLSV